jgi:uncharacterized membrane protein YhaH (DUF805 family)
MSFGEFCKDFFGTMKERISNPLTWPFILSWVTFNWKIVLYLLAWDKSIGFDEHILNIEQYSGNWRNLLLYPLISAIAYQTIYPWVSSLFVWFKTWTVTYRRTRDQRISERDYTSLMNSKYLPDFLAIIKYCTKQGKYAQFPYAQFPIDEKNNPFRFDDSVSFFILSGLIKTENNIVSLTDKGNQFGKRYYEEDEKRTKKLKSK